MKNAGRLALELETISPRRALRGLIEKLFSDRAEKYSRSTQRMFLRKKIVFEVFHPPWKSQNISSHFSQVLRLKQKQNHLSHFTVDEEKVRWWKRENFPRVFARIKKKMS